MRKNTSAALRQLHRDTSSRCFKIKVPSNPPPNLNAGDVWHTRRVAVTSLADASGNAALSAGSILLNLSTNAGNLPVRLTSIKAWAISGAAGQYPPTLLQVDYYNEEFCQTFSGTASIRDSIVDAGGMGGGCAAVGLYVPNALRLTRSDWSTGTATPVAMATALPQGARVLWHVVLEFKM